MANLTTAGGMGWVNVMGHGVLWVMLRKLSRGKNLN